MATPPLVPKSTAHLKRGQFWAIPLSDGTYGAGCVVGACTRYGKGDTRCFIAGVVNWRGKALPTSQDLAGRPIYKHAFAHIKAITESGGAVIGESPIDFGDLPVQAEGLSLPMWSYGVPTVLAQSLK